MGRLITTTFLLILFSVIIHAQGGENGKPKLVVGIVVDQMRFDYLTRYEGKYSEDGFKRLIREGYNYKNNHYNYIPTVTAAGHASIYTGATPSVHGIIGNSWYDRNSGLPVENVTDTSVSLVGSERIPPIGFSPHNILCTTVSDQLRLSTVFKSKVISVSLKNRGAIMPGGHTANGAYWHDWQTSSGYFVTSTYYMDSLPDWVETFNKEGRSSRYLNSIWNPMYPIESYTESLPDNNPYERTLRGKERPTFPYDFKTLREIYKGLHAEYQLIWVSPAGNSILTEFAVEAIQNENLGKDEYPDLLNISYSVPDAAGHAFGPQSIEIQDIYLRLDKDIANLLNYLDEVIGEGEYTVFLTADHAVVPVASFLHDKKLPTGLAHIHKYEEALSNWLNTKYKKDDWIQLFDGEQLYLNHNTIRRRGFDLHEIQNEVAQFLVSLDGISHAISAYHLQSQNYTSGIAHRLQNGYHPRRSGDVSLSFDPGYIQNSDPELTINAVKGTTHGSGWAYDTHVPLLWFGKGIPIGSSVRETAITDIAPTIAAMLGLQMPNGVSGKPCYELFER